MHNERTSRSTDLPAVHHECLQGRYRTTIEMPSWLDRLIFETLKGEYAPARGALTFNTNLHSSDAKIRTYLGTYFPRSFAETYCIFSSLLSAKSYSAAIAAKKQVSICSVGTGTGGDLAGLILSLENQLHSTAPITLLSIEGNPDAHAIAKKVVTETQKHVRFPIEPIFIDYEFVAPGPFHDLSLLECRPQFDFIITSKMLNELFNCGVEKEPYYSFLEAFIPMLRSNGALMMVDVTSKNDIDGSWIADCLNAQTARFLKNHPDYKTILPLTCNSFEEADSCKICCPSTKSGLYISHSHAKNERDKYCYRIIGKRILAEQLRGSPTLWSSYIACKWCDALNGK